MFDTSLFTKKILLLDGSMGTCIARLNLTEEQFKGERFADFNRSLKGLNDLLNITQPKFIKDIHKSYLDAGADIIETNTLNSNVISLSDYGCEALCYEINFKAAKLAKDCCRDAASGKPRFVAGSIGTTSKSLTLSPFDSRFDEHYLSYLPQINGLIDGGADLFFVETVFDALNAKAAIVAINDVLKERNIDIPVVLSCTISDLSGRILSGQTLEAFYRSFEGFNLAAIGMNCGLGIDQMILYIKQLAEISRFPICVYPNAGLPDNDGCYHQTPAEFAESALELLKGGFVNIIGGCCGTNSEHIKLLAEKIGNFEPRKIPDLPKVNVYAGLETLTVERRHSAFQQKIMQIGERTNVAGSKKFARLIREKKYDEAISIARIQIEQGADAIDICMDDGMLDCIREMENFLKLVSLEPSISRVPIMIDSSKWEVITTALKCVQGKPIINSISLKDGEETFLSKAKYIKKFGAALVVMLFDEQGQATTFERKIEIADRAYNLLISIDFHAENIILDPNILTISTGIAEHDNYAVDFIRACRWIKENLLHCKISGGVSNLSFAFRGNDFIRNTIHSVFLHYAGEAGLDMAIVNPGSMIDFNEIAPDFKAIVEDLVFNRRNNVTDDLLAHAKSLENNFEHNNTEAQRHGEKYSEQIFSAPDRLTQSLIKGISDDLKLILDDLLKSFSALEIIDKILMPAMFEVGNQFGAGKMFLPQVMKSASVLKRAIAILESMGEKSFAGKNDAESSVQKAKILLATVKGDVHDIGKNIVSVILSSNGYRIVDLGVMVEATKIVETAKAENVDVIGLSALISPSLEEIKNTLEEIEKSGLKIPVLIGGAALSQEYADAHLSKIYSGTVLYVKDASLVLKAVETLRVGTHHHAPLQIPRNIGIISSTVNLSELVPLINWKILFNTWLSHGEKSVQTDLQTDAEKLLNEWIKSKTILPKYITGIFPAKSQGNEIIVYNPETDAELTRLDTSRGNGKKTLSTLISPDGDFIGCFAATVGNETEKIIAEFQKQGDIYNALLAQSLADCLAEALSEYLYNKVKNEYWQFSRKGIRPAVGYPIYPLHSEKAKIFALLDADKIITLTENYAMLPQASVCGLYFSNADNYNFNS